MKPIAVVLAGGRGTRLWPLSTPAHPKQLLVVAGRSLLGHAIDRVAPLASPVVVTAPDLLEATVAAAPDVRVFVEPVPRGTGPATALALALAEQVGTDVVIVTPSDHLIADVAAFQRALAVAVVAARASGRVVVLGIHADRPETGFGWISAAAGVGARPVEKFVEKPPPEVADALLAAGAAWNAGVFVVPTSAATALDRRLPGAMAAARALLAGDAGPWSALPSASFDRAFLEHEPALVVACDCGWSDVGTLESLAQTWPAVGTQNRVVADAVQVTDAQGCVVWAPGRNVELLGVTDVIVIDANGTLLIAARQPSCK